MPYKSVHLQAYSLVSKADNTGFHPSAFIY